MRAEGASVCAGRKARATWQPASTAWRDSHIRGVGDQLPQEHLLLGVEAARKRGIAKGRRRPWRGREARPGLKGRLKDSLGERVASRRSNFARSPRRAHVLMIKDISWLMSALNANVLPSVVVVAGTAAAAAAILTSFESALLCLALSSALPAAGGRSANIGSASLARRGDGPPKCAPLPRSAPAKQARIPSQKRGGRAGEA